MPPFSFLDLIHPTDVQRAQAALPALQQGRDLAVQPSVLPVLAPALQRGLQDRGQQQQLQLQRQSLDLLKQADAFNRAQIAPSIALGALSGAVQVGQGFQARAAGRDQRDTLRRLAELGEANLAARQGQLDALLPILRGRTQRFNSFLPTAPQALPGGPLFKP